MAGEVRSGRAGDDALVGEDPSSGVCNGGCGEGVSVGANSPLFSVLVPCYNVEDYVEECVRSVASQTYGDWELVAVDDGSTDDTSRLLDALRGEVGRRMRVVRQANRGQLLARRAALLEAKGSYVLFLDADDMLRRDALEILAGYTKEYPYAVIQFKMSGDADFAVATGPEYPPDVTSPQVVDVAWYRREVCASSAFNNLCGKAIPFRTVGAEVDFSSYSHVRNAEDLLQLAYVLDKAETFLLVDDALYFYRANPVSMTHVFQPGFYRSVRTANGVLYDHVVGWHDEECLERFWGRLLKAVFASIMQLRGSGYGLGKLKSELEEMGQDELFRRAWAKRRGGEGWRSALLGFLATGKYGALAVTVRCLALMDNLRKMIH